MNRAGKRGKKNFDLEEAAIAGRQIHKELMGKLVSHSWLSGLFLSVGFRDTLMSLSWAGDCGDGFTGRISVFRCRGKDKELVPYLFL